MTDIENAKRIEGWMSEQELTWLASVARESDIIIEIGCFLGRSTRALADNCPGTVFAIDPYHGPYLHLDGRYFRDFGEKELKEFLHNLSDHLATRKVIQFRGTFVDFTVPLSADFIFIDGDHRYDAVKQDIEIALNYIKPDGIIAGHDYTHPDWVDVKRAVDEFFPNAKMIDSIWYYVCP